MNNGIFLNKLNNKNMIIISILLGIIIFIGMLVFFKIFNNYEPKEVNVYTITFDANGGSVIPDKKTLNMGETYEILPIPTRDNYEFIGWYTEKDGGSKIESSSIVTGDTIIYAHWFKGTYSESTPIIEYTLYFDANGGSVTPNNRILKENEQYGTLPTPTRLGYTFEGWYTSKDKGTKVESKTIITDDTTIYAHWTKSTSSEPILITEYTIFFDANGGSVTPNNRILKENEQYGDLPIPVREGYEFIGWYTSKDGGTMIEPTMVTNSNKTLYAHWRGLIISAEKTTMLTTTSQKLVAKITPDNTTTKDVTWECSNTSIASVYSSGVILAKKTGDVTITAKTNSGIKTEIKIKIVKANLVLIGNSKTYRESIESGSVYLELQNILLNRNFDVNLSHISKGGTSLYEKAMNEVEGVDFSQYWNQSYDIAVLQEDYKYVPNSNIYRDKGYYAGVTATIEKLKNKNPNVILYLRDGYYSYMDSIDEWYAIHEKGIKNTEKIAGLLNIGHINDGTILNNYVRQYVVTSENLQQEYYETLIKNKKHLKSKGAYLLAACIYKRITNRPATNITYYTSGLSKSEAIKLLEIANGC